jgi:O-6-methylguanine DNA methyltransferase
MHDAPAREALRGSGRADRPDDLDELLAAYFRPSALPADVVARVVGLARETRGALVELERRLAIHATPRGVRLIRMGRPRTEATRAARRLAERAREEVREFLAGQRAFFSVPVDLEGVGEFQRRVLEAAREIPFGEVRPYAWIAERIGHPRAARAVGTALAQNPVPLIVPCHRVGRSDGGLGGYIFGLPVKDRLWALERRTPVLEGCTSTRIVCRVGCVHGRHMRSDRRVVFASVDDARAVGYRPCKVCRPAA